MSGVMQGYILKLVLGGAFCFAVLAISGQGAQCEIVRLACACLMAVLVLAPLKGFDISAITFERQETMLRIDEAVENAKKLEADVINETIGEYIVAQARKLGIECSVKVSGVLREVGEYELTAAVITCAHDSEGISALREQMAGDLGLDISKISVKREGS